MNIGLKRGDMANTKNNIAVPKDVNKAIKTELFDALRDGLAKPQGKSKKSFVQEYVDIMLKQAKANPNGQIGQLIARQLLQDDIISQLDSATDKYLARDIDFNEFRIMKTLYHEQQEVFNDRYSKKIIVIGSRRIGKSELAARLLLRDALQSNHHAVYINLKFENAIRQCYDIVLTLAKSLGLAIDKEDKANGEISFINGSNILFKGNNDKAAADRLLGYKYSLAIVDEVQTQKNLQYLLDTVLGPTTADYVDSQIICLGTPPRIPKTYCERIWKEFDGWKKYGWDMRNNPFLHNIPELIKSLCKEKGVNELAPFIQREYYGQFIYDMESMVVQNPLFYEGGNDYIKKLIADGQFKADYIYGGVDFGFADYNAISMIAWDKKREIGYVLDNYKFNKASVTEIVEKAKMALSEAQDILIASKTDPHNVTFYGDNSDKSIIFELQTNYNFPIQCAYKYNKMEALSVLAELFKRKIYTPKNSPLADDFELTVYKRDEATDAILPELDDDQYHADVLISALYASRQLVFEHNPIGKEDALDIDKNNGRYIDVSNETKKPDDESDFTDDIN